MTILKGMKEISSYAGRSAASVLVMIRTLNFPAKKILGGWASETLLIDKWWIDQVAGDTLTPVEKEVCEYQEGIR
jgi:hypothetical protein